MYSSDSATNPTTPNLARDTMCCERTQVGPSHRDGWRDEWLRDGWRAETCSSTTNRCRRERCRAESCSSRDEDERWRADPLASRDRCRSESCSSRDRCRTESCSSRDECRTESCSSREETCSSSDGWHPRRVIEPCLARALCVVTMCYRHLLQFLSLKLNSFFGRTARRRRSRTFATLSSKGSALWMLNSHIATFLVFSALAAFTEACSSRNTPKPRPPPPSARPNVTFPTYTCPPAYAAWYCLNGATCFTIKIEDSLLYNCECANGYMGQRCEFKDLDGSYLPSRQRVLTASIAGGATIAVFLVVIVCITLYLHYQRKAKQRRIAQMDRTDGYCQKPRPFSRSLSIPMERLDERHKEQAVKAKSQLTELKTDSTAYRAPP